MAKRILLKVNRARRSCVLASVPVVVAVDVEAKKGPTWRGLVPVEVLSSERLGVRGAWAVLEPTELELRCRPAKVYGVAAALSNHQLPVTLADGNEFIRKPSVTSAASKATVAKPVPNSR